MTYSAPTVPTPRVLLPSPSATRRQGTSERCVQHAMLPTQYECQTHNTDTASVRVSPAPRSEAVVLSRRPMLPPAGPDCAAVPLCGALRAAAAEAARRARAGTASSWG